MRNFQTIYISDVQDGARYVFAVGTTKQKDK